MAVRVLGATLLLILECTPSSSQTLHDPGPVWRGMSDTTALAVRIRAHLSAADGALAPLRAPGVRTVASAFTPYKEAERRIAAARWLAELAANVHPEAGFRAAAQSWLRRVAAYDASLSVDRAVYEALAAVDLESADAETRYAMGRELDDYRRGGIELDEATRIRLVALRSEIAAVGARFERNIYDDVRTLRLRAEALEGLPPDFVGAHPASDDGFITLEMTRPNVTALLTFAEGDSVREAAFRARLGSGDPANLPLLDSLRALRHELAGLLGYPSWAAYAMAPLMAASPARVRAFLADVDAASAEPGAREAAALLAMAGVDGSGAATIAASDVPYLQQKLRQQAFGFDEQDLRRYLPYERVRDGVLEAFSQMFGLDFRSAPDVPVWSDDVEPFEVFEDGSLVARVYLDMHPRDGKYGHFQVGPIRLGGGQTVSEIALIGNFPGGRDGDPGLLTPAQMVVFFHEFGHVVHAISANSQHVSDFDDFQWDFVEAPSRLYEEWAYDPAVLGAIGRHYETGAGIPPDLIAAFRRASTFGRATTARQNLRLAYLALELFDGDPSSVRADDVEARLEAIVPFSWPGGLRISPSFLHLNGYSSNYYTYLWSEVIAADLFTGFDRSDLLNAERGALYRRAILAPTGTRPSEALVERFLGRPFNPVAWQQWLSEGHP